MDWRITTVCPLLSVINNDATIFSGFIVADKEQFQIQIRLKSAGILEGAQIDCEWRLKELLAEDVGIIEQRLRQCESLSIFLTELKTLIENRLRNRRCSVERSILLPEFYSSLIEEIKSLGWHRLSFIDSSFKELHLVAKDIRQRNHVLKIQLHMQHPERAPECHAEFPVPFDFNWNSTCKLADLFVEFEQHISRYQNFWDVLDDTDATTCILDPDAPSRSIGRRRIALGKACSLQIEIDPFHPRSVPDICFLGADSVVCPLKEKLNQNLARWDLNESVVKNLQTVLEIEFPNLKNSKKEDFTVECSICYSYHLEGELPDQTCEDKRCAQVFHRSCLYEWLRSLSTSRQSFNLLFGECPLCNSPITVRIVS